MEPTSLHCPSCGSAVPAEEIHLELSVARCRPCGAVFDLANRTRVNAPRRAPVPLPEKFRVDDGSAGLKVSWRWFHPTTLFLAFFCIIWDGSLLTFYSAALGAEDTPVVALIFPLLHVAAGVALTYVTAASFLNTTVIEASRSRLRIQHGPLPLKANVDLHGQELTQLYGTEQRHRSRQRTTITYTLHAIDRYGKSRKLLTGLTDLNQVLWLEQTIERHLRIDDAPVGGEVAQRTA